MGVGFSRSSRQLNFEVWDSGFGVRGLRLGLKDPWFYHPCCPCSLEVEDLSN